MKTLLIIALLTHFSIATIAASTPVVSPADSTTYKLTVGFTNIAKRAGTIYIALVNKDTDFNGDSYRKTRIDVPATGECQVSFEGLPTGRYAVKVFQDMNANQKLDWLGQTPTEPFGFSNVTMLMGPPSFGQCAFDLNAPKTIAIQLIGQ